MYMGGSDQFGGNQSKQGQLHCDQLNISPDPYELEERQYFIQFNRCTVGQETPLTVVIY